MTINIGINGFGRIGRMVFRAAQDNPAVKVKAINDLSDTKTIAHLLQYDSVHGRFNKTVTSDGGSIIVDGETIAVTALKDPGQIGWADAEVDIVLECTGLFRKIRISPLSWASTMKTMTHPPIILFPMHPAQPTVLRP
jgi:glyceraldehyde 3-phosphate dehydrogenase